MTTRRYAHVLLIAVTVVLGLGSRMESLNLPNALAANGGDVLAATCIFFGVRLIRAADPLQRVAVVAFTICVLIELQQLYQAPWAVKFRSNRIAGTLLGHGFLWIDLVRYAFGVALGVAVTASVECLLRPRSGRAADTAVDR